MKLLDEVVRRIEQGQPFRVAVPLENLSALLSDLAGLGASLPEIAVRRAEAGLGDALLDVAGRGGSWMLSGGSRRRPRPGANSRVGVAMSAKSKRQISALGDAQAASRKGRRG